VFTSEEDGDARQRRAQTGSEGSGGVPTSLPVEGIKKSGMGKEMGDRPASSSSPRLCFDAVSDQPRGDPAKRRKQGCG
jgi:hypothetical protein